VDPFDAADGTFVFWKAAHDALWRATGLGWTVHRS
jgi:hypothetical protein